MKLWITFQNSNRRVWIDFGSWTFWIGFVLKRMNFQMLLVKELAQLLKLRCIVPNGLYLLMIFFQVLQLLVQQHYVVKNLWIFEPFDKYFKLSYRVRRPSPNFIDVKFTNSIFHFLDLLSNRGLRVLELFRNYKGFLILHWLSPYIKFNFWLPLNMSSWIFRLFFQNDLDRSRHGIPSHGLSHEILLNICLSLHFAWNKLAGPSVCILRIRLRLFLHFHWILVEALHLLFMIALDLQLFQV